MNKIQFRSNLIDPSTRFLAFQPRNNSRQGKTKSNKKNNNTNKNTLIPCEPLGDKLLKAVIQKNQRKIVNNRKEKTEESFMENSRMFDDSRCFNHPDKKGEYFIQSNPNKKFCLKCNLILNGGNNSSFVTKQKVHKKQILDKFKQQLCQIRVQINKNASVLHQSIQQSQQNFSGHSNYINESFSKIKDQIQQKRRQLINNLIIAQQNLKRQYEQNLKKVSKLNKTLDKYQYDIKKCYDQIIEELPKTQFDQIMEEYNEKINKNIKKKLRSILIQDGICVYIPNVEIAKIIQKSNVEYYQPVAEGAEVKKSSPVKMPESNFGVEEDRKKTASNSLDSKMNQLIDSNMNKKNPTIKVQQRKKQIDLSLFEKKTASFLPHDHTNNPIQNYYQQNKQNVNTQNFANDYFNFKHDNYSKWTFNN